MNQQVLSYLNEKTIELVKKYPLTKAIFVYGSAARNDNKPNDVDTLVIVDDTSEQFTSSYIDHMSGEMDEISRQAREKLDIDIHFQSPKPLSVWWDLLRSGEPWVVTALSDACIIYDPSDYITPLSMLVSQGRIHGTHEKAQALMDRAPYRLREARRILLEDVTTELLSAMVETAQAVLMFYGIAPPAAKNLGPELRRNFVDKGMLDIRSVEYYEDFFELTEKISHNEITRVSGKEIKKHLERAVYFINKVDELFGHLEINKKKQIIDTSYEQVARLCTETVHMKKFDKKAIDAFKQEFVDTGMVSQVYLGILEKLFRLKDLSEHGKINDIPERDIYSSVVFAKNFEEMMTKSKNESGAAEKGRPYR